MTTTPEEQLVAGLERRAALVTVPADGTLRVERRIRTRRLRRHRVIGSLCVVVIAGVALGANLFIAPDRQSVRTATESDTTAEDAPGRSGAEGLPRLVVAMPELVLVQADISRDEFTTPEQRAAWRWSYEHYQSFRQAPDAWQAPSVYIYSGVQDQPIASGGTATVDINGSPAFLELSWLTWRTADDTSVMVHAPGVSDDELLAMARSMTPRPNGQGWDVPELPSGLQPIVDESPTPRPVRVHHDLMFEGEAGTVELNSSTAQRFELDDRIADYVTGATLSHTVVVGYPAVVVRSDFDTRVLWYDDEHGAAHYLILDGDIEARVDDVTSSLTQVSSEQWTALLGAARTSYWTGDESSPTSLP